MLVDRHNRVIWKYGAISGMSENIPVPVYQDPDIYPLVLEVRGKLQSPPLLVRVSGIVVEPGMKG